MSVHERVCYSCQQEQKKFDEKLRHKSCQCVYEEDGGNCIHCGQQGGILKATILSPEQMNQRFGRLTTSKGAKDE